MSNAHRLHQSSLVPLDDGFLDLLNYEDKVSGILWVPFELSRSEWTPTGGGVRSPTYLRGSGSDINAQDWMPPCNRRSLEGKGLGLVADHGSQSGCLCPALRSRGFPLHRNPDRIPVFRARLARLLLLIWKSRNAWRFRVSKIACCRQSCFRACPIPLTR